MPRVAPQMPAKLAEAAFELFGQRGFVNVTIDEIAARAGVTKGSFSAITDRNTRLSWLPAPTTIAPTSNGLIRSCQHQKGEYKPCARSKVSRQGESS